MVALWKHAGSEFNRNREILGEAEQTHPSGGSVVTLFVISPNGRTPITVGDRAVLQVCQLMLMVTGSTSESLCVDRPVADCNPQLSQGPRSDPTTVSMCMRLSCVALTAAKWPSKVGLRMFPHH